MFIVRDNRDARHLRISVKVPRSSKIGIHAHHFSECLRQRQREEPHARIQIQRQLAMRIGCHGLQQILDQKSVHLKERKMADPVFESAGFMRQIARPRQFKAIFLLV